MTVLRCLFVPIFLCIITNVYAIFDDDPHSNRSEVFYISDNGRFGKVTKQVEGIDHMDCTFSWLANHQYANEFDTSETWIMRMTYTHDFQRLHCEVETFGDKVTSKIPIFYFRFHITGLAIKKVVGRRSNQGRSGEPLTDKEYTINEELNTVMNTKRGFFGRLSYLAVTAEADEEYEHDEL